MEPFEISPELSLVDPDGRIRAPRLFCGHCGRSPSSPSDPAHVRRVCPRCGMGLMLSAAADVAPTPADPFLVVDSALTIRAVSERAEELLGVTETDAVDDHLLVHLVPAEAESATPERLLTLVAGAAAGDQARHDVVLRPRGEFGVRYWARIGSCGPPTAALIVLAALR